MEVTLSRRDGALTRLTRFAFILLACLFIGFVSYSSYAHAESNQAVSTQAAADTTAAAPANEGESFFIYFMVFVVLLVIIVVVIVASSTSASAAAIPPVFERWEE